MKNALLCLCLAVLCPGLRLNGQSIFGSIVGTVKDSSGSVVVKANVTVVNTDENTLRAVTTDSQGAYEALNLKPGHYRVSISHSGFQESSKGDVLMDARQISRIDFNLTVGSQAQTVNVEAEAGIIEGPGTVNLSMGLSKGFAIGERLSVRINGSFTNILNHTNLADPILNLTNASFGKITSAVNTEFGGARTGHVGVRIQF